ncbi:MAG TPA: hypothetical protein VF681_12630 [Abditibacteriaceae bacterium]|jgi:hypothetical protein
MKAPPEAPAEIKHDVLHADISAPPAGQSPKTPWQSVLQTLAFAFSALLSPYLVIPIGTVGIVATTSASRRDFLLWTFLSVFFSTLVPALYVVVQIWRGKITDVHVMEREQRGGPFTVALISSVVGALVLRQLRAPAEVWGIGLVQFLNGLVMLQITKFWKISMHVAVLSATILAALLMIEGISPLALLWMIPALIWARVSRGRHTMWQGMAACCVACALTALVLYLILYLPRSIYAR